MRKASFPLLIKPASYSCNLHCAHCFYQQGAHGPAPAPNPRMSEATLHALVKSYLAIPLERHMFIWQGGEPTLMGVDFYAQAFALQNIHKRHDSPIENCLQTNGTLLSKKFSKLLAQHDVLVGLSIDGPELLHDFYRTYPTQQGSYAKVLQGFHRLHKDGVKINSLTLLTAHNVNNAVDIFYHISKKNILFQQYIPCVEFDAQGRPCPWTVQPEAWGKALCKLFDAWLAEQGRISVRYFDSLLFTFLTGKSAICHVDTHCGQYAVVEHNGDIFPCDFFVHDRWKLGNIHDTPWSKVWEHPRYLAFKQAKSVYAQACTHCEWRKLCVGDCQKHRTLVDEKSTAKRSWLCEGYQLFFAHAAPILRTLAQAPPPR